MVLGEGESLTLQQECWQQRRAGRGRGRPEADAHGAVVRACGAAWASARAAQLPATAAPGHRCSSAAAARHPSGHEPEVLRHVELQVQRLHLPLPSAHQPFHLPGGSWSAAAGSWRSRTPRLLGLRREGVSPACCPAYPTRWLDPHPGPRSSLGASLPTLAEPA